MEEIRYCPMCGAYIPHDADKCLACGWTPNGKAEKHHENELETCTLNEAKQTFVGEPIVPTVDFDLDRALEVSRSMNFTPHYTPISVKYNGEIIHCLVKITHEWKEQYTCGRAMDGTIYRNRGWVTIGIEIKGV